MDLERLKDEIETGPTNIRATTRKLSIFGLYGNGGENIVIWKKNRGGVEIKWSGRIDVESEETVRCDLGHDHPVKKEKHWVWDYCELSEDDVEKLIEWLREKWKR